MAHLIKDGSRGQKNIADSPNKPPSRTLIIPSKDLVQVIGKVLFHLLSYIYFYFLINTRLGSLNHQHRHPVVWYGFVAAFC